MCSILQVSNPKYLNPIHFTSGDERWKYFSGELTSLNQLTNIGSAISKNPSIVPTIPTVSGGSIISSILTSTTTNSLNLNPTNNIIMQNKVAVFEITRDENDKITQTKFIKELWVETKNGSTVDFQVARDKDLAKYESSELVIKILSTISF
jgi:hypothetical protein